MKNFLFLTLFSICISQTHSQKIEWFIFNYQFDNALEYLDTNKHDMRESTHGLFSAVVYFYRYFSDQPSDRDKMFVDKMVAATKVITEKQDEIVESGISEDILMLGG